MKLSVAQINPMISDFRGNREKVLNLAHKAKEEGSSLVVFPELCLCGYPPMDLLDYEGFVRKNTESIEILKEELPKGIAVAVGCVLASRSPIGRKLTNSLVVLLDGRQACRQDKTLLPTYDVFDESRYFEPSDKRQVFCYQGERIGFAICEDIWWDTPQFSPVAYPVNPVDELIDKGSTILVSPSASPFYAGKRAERKTLITNIARKGDMPVVYVNQAGANDNLIFDGASVVYSRNGELLASGASCEEDFFTLELNEAKPIEEPVYEPYQEYYEALVLGIRDYLAKCGFKKVHLGLSGGVDSALVIALAVEALGPENVRAFALPSRYSSDHSLKDARDLAENLGVHMDALSIEETFAAALNTLEPLFRGTEPNVAEENLQARIRGLLLMGYSNKTGSLLLTTGNKSEMATGYCTLYGDMAGGLSVIGDLFKTEVYGLCGYINRDKEIIPSNILTKPPSAELRPDQKDSDSLPEYDVLDGILKAYLMDCKTADEIISLGFDDREVRRILGLVGHMEYKRWQAPPVLKVSRKAFGTGRRMPIARKLYET